MGKSEEQALEVATASEAVPANEANNNDKVLEPKTTNVDCDIGMNVSQNGSVNGHDKAAETKADMVDSESGTKLTRMDFFLPASKKRRAQNQVEAVDMMVSDCKEVGKCSTPIAKTKKQKEEKRRTRNQVEAVDMMVSDCKEVGKCSTPIAKTKKQKEEKRRTGSVISPLKLGTGENNPIFQFDLWTEAKLAAKENAQLCGGKPTHPFFSQLKATQQSVISSGVNTNLSAQQTSSLDGYELLPAPPFHITQLVEVEVHQRDSESSSIKTLAEKPLLQAVRKRNSLDIDAKELVSLLKSCIGGVSVTRRKEKRPCRPSFDSILNPLVSFLKNSENRSKDEGATEDYEKCFSFAHLEDRLKSWSSHFSRKNIGEPSKEACCRIDLTNATQNLLWTDIYQPQCPEQVCGNREAVEKLNVWLQNWKRRSVSLEKDTTHKKLSNECDYSEDRGCFEDDSDSGSDAAGDGTLPNVMFLAGPVGCGKTTAIYTCAKAHGFTVIEVNCSDNRSGTLIKQKFSESMESHRLGKWSADTETVLNPTTTKESFSSGTEVSTEISHRNRLKEEKKVNKKAFQASPASYSKTKKSLPSRNMELMLGEQPDVSIEKEKSMTILLFEDVDMVFEDDRGFMAAVTQLAATAKRPIILTSNGKECGLPYSLSAQVLEFKRPSTEDLVILAYLICAEEGVICSPLFLQQVVKVCHHDMRRLLNYLQFWCQGQNSARSVGMEHEAEDTEVEQTTELFPEVDPGTMVALFTSEAQQRLLPAYLPLSFPCEVTVLIASRLTERVTEMEDELTRNEGKKLEQNFVKKRVLKKTKKSNDIGIDESQEATDANEDLTEQEFQLLETPVKNLKEAKTVARSPVLRDRVKRRLAIAMSDSDEDKDHNQHNMHQTSGYDQLSGCSSTATTNMVPITAASCSKPLKPEGTSCSLEQPLAWSKNILKQADFSWSNEPVSTLWSQLQKSTKKHNFCMSSVSKESFSVISSVSYFSDNLSVCDIMSAAHSRKHMLWEGSMLASCSRIYEHDSLLQRHAELAHHALKLCIEECRATPNCIEVKGSDLLEDVMLISANDPDALGKAASEGGSLLHSRRILPEASSLDQELRRLENKTAIQQDLCSELPPRAQRSLKGKAFFERTSFLSRMVHLHERSSSQGNRRRGRGCQNYFSTHPWNLSKRSVDALQQHGSFSKSQTED